MKIFIILCCSMFAALLSQAQTPDIFINPESLEQGLYTGDTSSRVISVSNLGTGDLSCTMTVEPISPTGSVNNAIKFDGTNDYAVVYNDDTLQLTTQLTIEAWINFEEGGSGRPCIISKGPAIPNYEVFFDTTLQSRTIGLSIDPAGTIVSQTILSAGTWYHVAFTYDGALMNLYINGTLDKSQPGTGSIKTSYYNLFFAKRNNTTNHRYKGELDEVRIWNIARSQNEIINNMNHELSSSDTGLAGYWKFNEESGNVAFDGTSNGNNANLVNGTLRVISGARIINWLSITPFSMDVTPGNTSMLNVSFNAIGLDGGTYDGQVIINSNDPEELQLLVPVQLVVTPTAHINLSVTQLDFGDIYIGASKTMSFIVSNTGNDTLRVSSMTCPNADYLTSHLILATPPGGSDTVNVTYAPSAPGNDNATLTIQSNDLIWPAVTLSLTGIGIVPPVIIVDPESVDTVLYSGKPATQSLTISNTGGSELVWEINLENSGFPTVTFTKADYAGWTDPANQDRITQNVYITRANSQGIFNACTESGYNSSISPENTKWAYGYSEDLEPGDYRVWRDAVNGYPPGMVNNPISLHLISEDLYFNVLFHSWTDGNSGGGFSYTRTSVLPPWLQVSQTSGVLPAGASVDLEVYFDAANLERGDWDGIIEISSNDPLNPVVNVPAHLEVIDAASIFADRDTLDFGVLYTGYDISKTLQLAITNTGSLDLLVTEVSVTPSAFTANPGFAGIDPGETEIFNVIFTPVELGDYSGEVTFTNNDPLAGEYSVVLTGRFLEPPVIHVTPLALDEVLYSGKNAAQYFTVSNTGESDLEFEIQTNLPSWLIVNPGSGTCPPGTSMDIHVTFDASHIEGGNYSDSIMIVSNDPANPAINVQAELEVIDAPSIIAKQGMLNFREVFIGSSESLELVVENAGSLDLLIFSTVIVPVNYTVFPPYASIDPGGTEIFTITFSPQAVGDYPGSLTFNCNDPVFGEYIIFLEGTGLLPPVISVSPDSLIVEILPGQTITKPFTIYNTGGSNLNFTITPGEESSNYALEFDGIDDYITAGDNINIANNSFTLEIWAKEGPGYGFHNIWAQGTGSSYYGLYAGFTDYDTFIFSFWGDALETQTIYTDLEWHHWACTFDAYSMARKIYRDGMLVASNLANANYQGTGMLYIGTVFDPTYYNIYYRGNLDEVRIWSVARTQEEIQLHSGHELIGNEAGLVGYWNFSEGTGLNVHDKSPNGNHGTLINGVTWTSDSAPMAPAWLSVSQGAGTIPANSSLIVDAVFNATDLDEGDYYANITIASNDPVSSLLSIPVHMLVHSGVGISSVSSSQFAVRFYPNPLNDQTTFEYELDEPGSVTLLIFNHLGQQVEVLVNEQQDKGKQQVRWNAEGLPAGIYYYRLTTDDYRLTTTGKLVVR